MCPYYLDGDNCHIPRRSSRDGWIECRWSTPAGLSIGRRTVTTCVVFKER
jgi:hypothetical protein